MQNLMPPETSMSLEDAIQEFIRIDSRYRELSYEKKRALEILVSEALEVRGATNTTRLNNHDGKVQLKVEFGTDYKCDTDLLNEVKEMLGDDVFEKYFKLAYAPKLKELKPFLASKSTDERIETAKGIIRKAMTAVPKSPQITIEKGRLDPNGDDLEIPF
jgi:hypothetical protein